MPVQSPYDVLVKTSATLFTLHEDKFDEIVTKFPALLKRLERRGLAVYGDRWLDWTDMARSAHAMWIAWRLAH